MEVESRKEPSERAKRHVWAAAAGRCTFCNTSVLSNEVTGDPVSIGELAHNVGATSNSPRGDSDLDRAERAEADNLILTCRNCHKPVDDGGNLGRYTVEQLRQLKRDHEQRIYELTKIGRDSRAALLRVVGNVWGVPPELSRDTVRTAATRAGLYPQLLPGSFWDTFDVDLRDIPEPFDSTYFERAAAAIDVVVDRVHRGVQSNEITRVAVFAFARMTLLTYLGAKLDDKVPLTIFQRHRVDEGNAWVWPAEYSIPDFDLQQVRTGTDAHRVALMLNLSGVINENELPTHVDASYTVFVITSSDIGPHAISSPTALHRFEQTCRRALALIETNHGKPQSIDVFSAVPLTAAITLGRVLMPGVSPTLRLFERDESKEFFCAMEVRR